MMTLGLNWGANASETAAVMPCDALAAGAGTRADRAISIDAPLSTVFAWLCQLRVAPYRRIASSRSGAAVHGGVHAALFCRQ